MIVYHTENGFQNLHPKDHDDHTTGGSNGDE